MRHEATVINPALQQALAWHRAGRIADAAAAYRRLIARDPRDADALHLLGVTLAQAGPSLEAVTLIRAALELQPRSALAHYNLGNALSGLARHGEALACYQRALELAPSHAGAHRAAGQALQALGRHAEALSSYERALELTPSSSAAELGRGIALGKLGRHIDSEASLARAVELGPDEPEAHYNWATALGTLGRHEPALRAYQRTLELQPSHLRARWNRALLHLLCGQWRAGWEGFEARFEMDGVGGDERGMRERRWSGSESLRGKSILLWAERGLGDTLQFSRYAPAVRRLADRVILEVQPRLKALLLEQYPGVQVIAAGEPHGAIDYQCPLLSLPGAFRTEPSSVPCASAYLRADPAAVQRWAARLPRGTDLRVGIAWQGNPEAERHWAHGRSMPLGSLEPLARLPGVQLVSLQVGTGAEQLAGVGFRDRVLCFDDLDCGASAFLDSAALLMSLDLLICTDSAVAHLGGALGVPVWLALHTRSEWRWLRERTDSPWYPSLRLFRQSSAGQWQSVVADMLGALTSLATTPGARSRTLRQRS
ncbi:MAG TPA: tetratricopeptide repeat-containing glycosyltransferase family protein [Steroidobacteraceae bacterium]|nr:tetratricopeptide repeat-containing glycosyltransferase family protein [Steroidobacteraceae bacterium]